MQGDVPKGVTANYNCGVRLIGALPRAGAVQGYGDCAYVRDRHAKAIYVVDMRNPARPVEVATLPTHSDSESFRLVAAPGRVIMVSGSSVYEIGADCRHPVLRGEIAWPHLTLPGVNFPIMPHDLRVNHAATKVFASFGLWEADISNLNDPGSWKIIDHRCELAAQIPGPWQEMHRAAIAAHQSLCVDQAQASPKGSNYAQGTSSLVAGLLWPVLSHSPDFNGDDTRLYIADPSGGNSANWSAAKLRILDMTGSEPRVLGEVDGGGHGLDWFRVGGRDYVLHSNEHGEPGIAPPGAGDSCAPYPRPYGLGWALEAYISDVTDPARAHHVSMLQIAINNPENCAARKASGGDASIAYHLIDNAFDPHFAAVNFGNAGLRIYDIRHPEHPGEVAYFNHGPLVHAGVGYYDARRYLIYVAGGTGLWVLEIEPQVRRQLGL